MSPDSGYPPLLKHNDPVRPPRRGNPLSNDDLRNTRGEPRQGAEKRGLGFGVKSACRVIQNENFSGLKNRPRQCDPLPLASGETGAALSQQRIVAFRQLRDKFIRLRGRGRRADLPRPSRQASPRRCFLSPSR